MEHLVDFSEVLVSNVGESAVVVLVDFLEAHDAEYGHDAVVLP